MREPIVLYWAVIGNAATQLQDGFFQVSKPTKSRTRTQLNRAQLKAYEARRAEEVQRRLDADAAAADVAQTGAAAATAVPVGRRRVYALSQADEMAIIRSDLKRLMLILAVLLVVLAIATVVLR